MTKVLRKKFDLVQTEIKLERGYLDILVPCYCFIEVKQSFCADAFWQLQRYQISARRGGIFEYARERLVVIAKHYTTNIRPPVPFKMLGDLDELRNLSPGFHVYIWSRFDR